MNHFVFLSFYFGAKKGSPALGMENSLVVRRVSPGRIIVVSFWTKCAVPRQIKPGILKLTTSRGQRNLCTVFIFVSREEKGFYRIVSLGHQNFDCRSYCGLSRRMQGLPWNKLKLCFPNITCPCKLTLEPFNNLTTVSPKVLAKFKLKPLKIFSWKILRKKK